MEASKRSIIIDIDGTAYNNFSDDDKKIICKIFDGNVFVKILDKVLWTVNSLDVIPNSMTLLNLRLMVYSILSFKRFSKIREQYKIRYQNLLSAEFELKKEIFQKIEERYKVIFVTNNVYAVDILKKKPNCEYIYALNFFSRKRQIKEKSKIYRIIYVIGNNFTDDILLANELNLNSIYVGISPLKCFFNLDLSVKSFDEVVALIADCQWLEG